ncbi:MAG: DUF3810 domain-containing protein [Bacteroidota bacterium]|nr:DUF3810 domain-containing protein [Bacteroidota bacterium]
MMKNTIIKQQWIKIGVLFIVALLIKLLSLNNNFIERYYSTGIYVFISRALRILFGWLPFSIGDILYFIAALWLLIKVFCFIRALFKKQMTRQKLGAAVRKFFSMALIIYILFNALWGLNYNRRGIAYQLGLKKQNVSRELLFPLTQELLSRVNSSRRVLPNRLLSATDKNFNNNAVLAYQNLHKQFPFISYQNKSVKSSFYNIIGNYLGFSGYYNPFSGEAQVNTSLPKFLLPYIACHEMAHQLGYATEDEANFVGYLAAVSAPDPRFQYSVYFDLFNYANSELFLMDSTAARNNYKQLDTLVKADLKTYRHYINSYKNPFEPLVTDLYGNYLKANNQPEGMETYNEVISWLIFYRMKYGRL